MDAEQDLTNASAPTAFHYNQLPYSSIRLLSVRPRLKYDEVRYRTEAHRLDSLPPYKALSYRWGTATDRISIQIDGLDFSLMPNAWHALQYLDLPGGTYVWMDAICIDQGNVDERNAQVPLMGTIYEKASEVIVWLGLETASMSIAFLVLHSADLLSTVEFFREKCSLEGMDGPRQALLEFSENDYWIRTWVVQELMFAKHLTLACGQLRLDWSKVVHFCEVVLPAWQTTLMKHSGHGWEIADLLTTIENSIFSALLRGREEFKHQLDHRNSRDNHELPYFLGTYRNSKCLDVRDRIYGLVGLWNRIAKMSMQVDYTKSPSELLIASLSYAIKDRHDRMLEYGTILQDLLNINAAADPVIQSWLMPRLRPRGFSGSPQTSGYHWDKIDDKKEAAALDRAVEVGIVQDG